MSSKELHWWYRDLTFPAMDTNPSLYTYKCQKCGILTAATSLDNIIFERECKPPLTGGLDAFLWNSYLGRET